MKIKFKCLKCLEEFKTFGETKKHFFKCKGDIFVNMEYNGYGRNKYLFLYDLKQDTYDPYRWFPEVESPESWHGTNTPDYKVSDVK